VAAIAVASGQAALHLAVTTLLSSGDHIVAGRALYGGSHNLLYYTLPRFGIQTTFVDVADPAAWAAAIQPNTKLFFAETLGNPGNDVLDIPTISALAHAHDLPLMVDATLTTPYLSQPLSQGADIVMHSATKFLSGHGVVIGGVLVDGGTFDWAKNPTRQARFATLNAPYDGFHHMVFSEESSTAAFSLRARREGLRDFGACMAPFVAWQILQGMETLSLRMQKHIANAKQIADFLTQHPFVASVSHPMLPSHRDHALAAKLYPKGSGAVFSFSLKGNRQQGKAFIDALQLFSHLANVGDAKSLVIHPASTTHFRMDAAALAQAGISEGTIRLSVGLEDCQDLIDDLSQALKQASKA
jgi:O-acetylhomoserine (thiol)-lyase